MAIDVACIGDSSNHGGALINSAQDGSVVLANIEVCVNGCLHSCPIPGHGVTPVAAITSITKVNGKLVVTTGAVAGCGAVISAPSRGWKVS